jgi:hypothetical protein
MSDANARTLTELVRKGHKLKAHLSFEITPDVPTENT